MSVILEFLKALDRVRRDVKAGGKQLRSPKTKERLRSLSQDYFLNISPAERERGTPTADISAIDDMFRQLNEMTHRSALSAKYDNLLKSARSKLAKLETAALGAPPPRQQPDVSRDDEEIEATLRQMLPSAADAYQQGLRDLRAGDRVSWRGPATDFREALRETLDYLAPDEAVIAMPGFQLEANTQRPTMKQKARFILRSRDTPGGQLQSVEDAVNAVEANISAITRAVYTRSSVSTHTPTTQQEVIRVHHWVRLVLCDLLAIDMAA